MQIRKCSNAMTSARNVCWRDSKYRFRERSECPRRSKSRSLVNQSNSIAHRSKFKGQKMIKTWQVFLKNPVKCSLHHKVYNLLMKKKILLLKVHLQLHATAQQHYDRQKNIEHHFPTPAWSADVPMCRCWNSITCTVCSRYLQWDIAYYASLHV